MECVGKESKKEYLVHEIFNNLIDQKWHVEMSKRQQ